ncbi:uncharacterized protein MELLADRAFT_26344, partial [Melampsora larici-populina 98AG31]
KALQNLREFLSEKTCYDILPESYRLIVFDNSLGIKRALTALMTNGVVSAPLYDSTSFRFCGMFTLTDVIHHDPYALAAAEVESFPLSRLRDIEQAIDAPPPPTVHVHPDAPLLEACEQLIRTHARRIPLIDQDATTGKDAILCVLTQYRVLKFIAININSINWITRNRILPHSDHDPFHPLATATLQTTVFDVVHMFSERGISAVPIVDENGSVVDLYEAVDIVDLVRSDAYRLLDLTIEEAIARRSPDYCGVTVCSADDSLSNILKYIGERRVHRFVIVDDLITQTQNRLVGILSLSDIMKHLVGNKGKSLQG